MALTEKDLQAIQDLTKAIVSVEIKGVKKIITREVNRLARITAKSFRVVDHRFDRLEVNSQEMKIDMKDVKEGQERIERKQDIQQTLLEQHDTRLRKLEPSKTS